MDTLVAKKYAKALLELDGISLDEIQEQINAIAEVITSNKEVADFLASPLIKNDVKYSAIVEPLKDKLDSKITALLELMSQKGRLNLIPELSAILSKEIMIKSNKFKGVVESNEDIDEALKQKLEKKLANYSGAEIELEFKKDDIDGVKVEVSDLGLELNFSKESVKKALLEHIQKAL
jgi:F-type H+-transporting ATPase subunit delta